jgi:hypothetical protein
MSRCPTTGPRFDPSPGTGGMQAYAAHAASPLPLKTYHSPFPYSNQAPPHTHITQHSPNMNCAGKRLKVLTRAMFPAMVLVTCPPSSRAPRNSKMAAITTADHSLRVLEPTLVPNELATSLAPVEVWQVARVQRQQQQGNSVHRDNKR